MKVTLDILKMRLPDYLEAIGAHVIRRTDTHISAACPIHGGTKGNFRADLKERGWVWTCFSGCGGDGGSVIDLHAALNGLSSCKAETIAGAAQVIGLKIEDQRELTDAERKAYARQMREREAKAKASAKAKADQATLTTSLHSRLVDKLTPFAAPNWRADLWHDSPVTTESPEDDPKALISCLFSPDVRLWMGDVKDSGKAEHAANFRTCREWLTADLLPPRISAGVFRSDSFSRSKENIVAAPFIVIESDDLIGHKPTTDAEREENKAMSYALARYCQSTLGLSLRAVIDSGNKSLHLYFDRPPPDELDALRQLAPGLHIDTGLLDQCAAAPLRMPGCVHEKTGTPATLLYLNHKSS